MSELKPWQMSADDWQRERGVHRPHIAEISQHQYATLSRRGRAHYDAKRAQEWQASATSRDSWRDAVIAAFDAELFAAEDAGVSHDARVVIREELRRRFDLALYTAWHSDNRIRTMDELHVGDRVYILVGNNYGVVIKKNRRTVNVQVEGWERAYKHDPAALRYLSYDDLKAKLTKGQS